MDGNLIIKRLYFLLFVKIRPLMDGNVINIGTAVPERNVKIITFIDGKYFKIVKL